MITNKSDIISKFENGDIPSQNDFIKIFDSYVHKNQDKADFKMVEAGTDHEHYITPALLRSVFQNSGIISGNCYFPFKEYRDSFSGQHITLENEPVENSVKIFKNGQLMAEPEDYELNYKSGVIEFSDLVDNRNIEINYWYKNLDPLLNNSDSIFGSSSIPFKENFSGLEFNTDRIILEKTPLKQSVRVYKNGQLLREEKDYTVDYATAYETAAIKFADTISNRNIEVDYWYEGTASEPGLNNKYVDLTTNQSVAGNKTFTEALESKGFIKTGGASNQYLMADGSVSTSTASDYDAGHSAFDTSAGGYQKFSNGLILQWAFLSSGSVRYTFPLVWPQRACSVVLSTHRNSSGSRGFNHVFEITKTAYDAVIDGQYGFMFAIGY